jgi:acyl-CoA dehydrogenase
METLHLFATEEQRKQWLEPLLAGEIRSAFSMTEPAVASSDAPTSRRRSTRDGDDYVINGRKWWTSGPTTRAARS